MAVVVAAWGILRGLCWMCSLGRSLRLLLRLKWCRWQHQQGCSSCRRLHSKLCLETMNRLALSCGCLDSAGHVAAQCRGSPCRQLGCGTSTGKGLSLTGGHRAQPTWAQHGVQGCNDAVQTVRKLCMLSHRQLVDVLLQAVVLSNLDAPCKSICLSRSASSSMQCRLLQSCQRDPHDRRSKQHSYSACIICIQQCGQAGRCVWV